MGTLTDQELAAANMARYDLGPGYPQLEPPPWCAEIVNSEEIRAASLSFPPAWNPDLSVKVDRDIESAVRRLLRIPDSAHVMSTFSGSVALDRAMTAVVRLARRRGCTNVRVITTSPSIDIMKLFLSERSEIEPTFVRAKESSEPPFILDSQAFFEALGSSCERFPGSMHVALLTSPENPTGEIWTGAQLESVSRLCRDLGAVLMVDHCFLLAGVQDATPPAVWGVAEPGLDWIGIWDTGKTLGLNEEKLGFIVSGGASLPEEVRSAVNTVQFGVARRQKMSLAKILSDARFSQYTCQLRQVCLDNADVLRDRFSDDARFLLRTPRAGSFALIDCARLGMTDESIRVELLKRDVGVIAGRVFFHADPVPRSYIRLALAREPRHFGESVLRLREALLRM